jgi:hypothetical protein
MHGGALKAILDFNGWAEWIRSLDSAWLYLLILALVVTVVVLWSSSLRPDNTRASEKD